MKSVNYVLYFQLFSPWKSQVKLDIWHFMRRFACGVKTDNHPLYGTFLAQLAACIFEWCDNDVKLREAKKAEMEKSGVSCATEEAIDALITKQEMSQHCRRRTRGKEETGARIQALLQKMWHMTDSLGVALIDPARMTKIWEIQKHHLGCIQDPPGLALYTETGSLQKGGQTLKTYRCARGSVSLESIHLHQNRFVPVMYMLQ